MSDSSGGRRVANPFHPDWTAGDADHLRSMPTGEYWVYADLAPRGELGTIYRAVVGAMSSNRSTIETRLGDAGFKVISVPGHLTSPRSRQHVLVTAYPNVPAAIEGLRSVPAPTEADAAGTARRQERAAAAQGAERLVRQIRAACIEFGPETTWTWVVVSELYQPLFSTKTRTRELRRVRAVGPFGETIDRTLRKPNYDLIGRRETASPVHWVSLDGDFYRGVDRALDVVFEDQAPDRVPRFILRQMLSTLRSSW